MSSSLTVRQELSRRQVLLSAVVDNSELCSAIASVSDRLLSCISSGGKVMTAGNGGSAAQAQHFCAELMGRFKANRSPIQAVSLCSDMALTTCISNDYGYERIFSRQIEAIGRRTDAFVAFTTSGKSRNIIEALCECRQRDICSIVFTGKATDAVAGFADYTISIPTADTAMIQELHMQAIHIVCGIIEASVSEDHAPWRNVLQLGSAGYRDLILDRDGVVNHVKANGYIKSPSELALREDFLLHAKALADAYRHVLIVSNQKGVGKGLMSVAELEAVNSALAAAVAQAGGRIDKFYVGTSADNNAPENKPNTGMAELIKKDFPEVDFSKTVVVGDSASDALFADKLKSRFVYVRTR